MIRIERGLDVGPDIFEYAIPSLQICGRSRQLLLDGCRSIKRAGDPTDRRPSMPTTPSQAGEVGVAPFERPAPRWSLYVSIFRQKGLAIETVLEPHGGPYAGRRGRYVLRSLIEIVDREDAA